MQEKPTVYLETTIISYLTSPMSRDLIVAGHQQVTQEWWATKREQVHLIVSDEVLREIRVGDPLQSKKRTELVSGIQVLGISDDVRHFVRHLLEVKALPPKAVGDAFHLAISTVNGIDVLLTWNCRHLANIQVKRALERICVSFDYRAPLISTPLELMGDDYD